MNDAGASARVLSRLSAWLPGRVFVMTNEGYIGLAPCGTQTDDVVSVLLGCPLPMVLRSRSVEKCQVVGSGYFHGLMHGEGVLGTLPGGWTCESALTESSFFTESFHHRQTGATTSNDPHLGQLPLEWGVETESTFSLSTIAEPKFVNRVTGEVRDTDPRLTPEAIRQRGVNIQAITLI